MEKQTTANPADDRPTGGYIRLSWILSALQKDLERVKADRVRSLGLRNREVFLVYMLYAAADGMSAEELSRVCHVDRSLVSRSMQVLAEKGLIACPGAAEGKRRYGLKLRLTEKGRKTGEMVHALAGEAQAFLDRGIPREDIERMYTTLARLHANFEELNRMTRRAKAEGRIPDGACPPIPAETDAAVPVSFSRAGGRDGP